MGIYEYQTKDKFRLDFTDVKHDYTKEVYQLDDVFSQSRSTDWEVSW